MKSKRDNTTRSAARARRPSTKDRAPRLPRTRVAKLDARTPKRAKRLLPILPSGQIPCLSCGICCSYVAVEIDGGETLRGATDILWYLYHPGVSIYVDEDDWMVQFETRCQHQLPDQRCGIYETRPQMCREYDETACEVNADEVGHTLYSAREFLDYMQRKHKRIYNLIQKRGYMPPDANLAGRAATNVPIGLFQPRYDELRSRRARALKAR